jgi:hypothetical protein
MTDRRLATLRAALGFRDLPPHAPELRLLPTSPKTAKPDHPN